MQTLTPDQAEQARTAAVKILEDQATSFVAPANLAEKQALYLRLDARRLRGEALTPDESNWMEAFGRSYE